MHCLKWTCPVLSLLLAVLAAGAAPGAFTLVDDFTGLAPGPIDEQNGWTAADTFSVVAEDPAEEGNQVLSVATQSTRLHHELLLPAGDARMLFLRFRVAAQLTLSLGLSDLASPYRFDHFEVELGVENATPDLRINDGGVYEVLCPVAQDTWYNCWLRVDNSSDLIQIWMHARGGDDADAGDQLSSGGQTYFAFRNGTDGDLRTFYIKTGGGSGVNGPMYIDDIFLEDWSSMNLTNPARHPAGAPSSESALTGAAELSVVATNPLRSGVESTVWYVVRSPEDIRLSVFDAGGREIGLLARGRVRPGLHQCSWNGRDRSGRPIGAGVYHIRLQAGRNTAATRVVLIG